MYGHGTLLVHMFQKNVYKQTDLYVEVLLFLLKKIKITHQNNIVGSKFLSLMFEFIYMKPANVIGKENEQVLVLF